ncbi:hypothetical protein C8Q79DRAFT_479973 [Trametes meyenii]|nr:hypothetical protein C8Q79DRAFT_479973 [Trametes meyenii]
MRCLARLREAFVDFSHRSRERARRALFPPASSCQKAHERQRPLASFLSSSSLCRDQPHLNGFPLPSLPASPIAVSRDGLATALLNPHCTLPVSSGKRKTRGS